MCYLFQSFYIFSFKALNFGISMSRSVIDSQVTSGLQAIYVLPVCYVGPLLAGARINEVA